jgi:ABC-type transport system substrate-binding protein
MLQSGQVDALSVSQPQITTVEAIPGITIIVPRYIAYKGGPVIHFGGNWIMDEDDQGNPYENTPRPDLPWVGGKMGDADFEDAKNVRLAMSYAIDREEMLQEILDGQGCIDYAFGIDTCSPHWDSERGWDTPFNVEKAQQLMKDAGYEDGFEVNFWNYSTPDTDMGQGCEAIANYWTKNLGLTVNIDTSAYQIHRPKFINLRAIDFVWCFGAYANIGEASFYLDLIPDATAGRVLSNLGYDYPESFDLMDRLSVEFDNEAAWSVIKEYHDIMGPDGYFYTFGTVSFDVGGIALGPNIGDSSGLIGMFAKPIDFHTLEPVQE